MRNLLDWLKALRIMRRYMRCSYLLLPAKEYVPAAVKPDALWTSCLRRAAMMPNRTEWDHDAACLLIAGTARHGTVTLIAHPWHKEEEVEA